MTTFSYNGINFGYVKLSNIGHTAVRDPSDTDLLHTKFTIHIQSIIAVAPGGGANGIPIVNPFSKTEPGLSRAFELATGALAQFKDQFLPGQFRNISTVLSPAEIIKQIRHMLMTPRRFLMLSHNGKEIISVNGLDDANGPKPQSANVHHISDNCYEIDYVVEVCLADCNNKDDGKASGINAINKSDWASFRYSTSQDIDEHGMSTITMSGKLITRSSLLAKGGPDMMRYAIAPPPIPGFRRRSHYEVQADGLGLAFSFTDTELYISPPPGTSEARGTHTISTNMGGKWVIDVSLTLTARKEQDKKTVMEMAVAIVLDRIRRSGAENVKGTNQVQIMKCTIQEEMYGPSVSVSMQAFTSGPTSTIQNKKNTSSWAKIGLQLLAPITGLPFGGAALGAAVVNSFEKDIQKEANKATPMITDVFNFGGDPLGSSKTKPVLHDFGVRGYTPWLHFLAAAFNDPCLAKEAMSASSGLATPAMVTENTNETAVKSSLIDTGLGALKLGIDVAKMFQGIAKNTAANGDESKISIVNNAEVFDVQDSIYAASTFTEASGIWDTYLCKFKSHRDTGYRGFPAMQDGGGTAFVKLHDDTMKLTVSWIGKKLGAPPEVPSPDSTDSNLVLLDVVEGRDDVKELADGQSVEYTVSGEYVYGIIDWEAYNNRWPIPPWLELDQSKLQSIEYTDTVSGEAEDSTSAEGQIVSVGA